MSGGLGIQDAVAALIALAALGWLVRRWLKRRREKRCACDGCPAAETAARAIDAASAASATRGAGGAAPSDSGLVTIEGLGPGRR